MVPRGTGLQLKQSTMQSQQNMKHLNLTTARINTRLFVRAGLLAVLLAVAEAIALVLACAYSASGGSR